MRYPGHSLPPHRTHANTPAVHKPQSVAPATRPPGGVHRRGGCSPVAKAAAPQAQAGSRGARAKPGCQSPPPLPEQGQPQGVQPALPGPYLGTSPWGRPGGRAGAALPAGSARSGTDRRLQLRSALRQAPPPARRASRPGGGAHAFHGAGRGRRRLSLPSCEMGATKNK